MSIACSLLRSFHLGALVTIFSSRFSSLFLFRNLQITVPGNRDSFVSNEEFSLGEGHGNSVLDTEGELGRLRPHRRRIAENRWLTTRCQTSRQVIYGQGWLMIGSEVVTGWNFWSSLFVIGCFSLSSPKLFICLDMQNTSLCFSLDWAKWKTVRCWIFLRRLKVALTSIEANWSNLRNLNPRPLNDTASALSLCYKEGYFPASLIVASFLLPLAQVLLQRERLWPSSWRASATTWPMSSWERPRIGISGSGLWMTSTGTRSRSRMRWEGSWVAAVAARVKFSP